MAHTMQVDVVDSEKSIFSGVVEYLVAPAVMGEIGVYPQHVPLISNLKSGLLRIKVPNQELQLIYAISGGFIEIQGNHVTVLADIVERTDALDEARLLEQKHEAIERIKRSSSTMSNDVAKAQASLEIAIAQLKALDYIRKQSKRA